MTKQGELAGILERFAKIPERAPERVKRVVSPAGEWFLAEDAIEAAAFLRTHEGAAVFTKRELAAIRGPASQLEPPVRQELLGDLIAVKSVFPGAVVQSVTAKPAKKRANEWEPF